MSTSFVRRARVVTVDPLDRVLHDATIVIVDGEIAWIGPDGEAPAGADGDRVIDAEGGIVMPGLVNTHTHLAMTMFRGLADDMDLDGFLGTLLPAEGRVLSPSTVEIGTRLAAAECLRSGITTALDMYFFPEAIHAAADPAGLRVLTGPVFIEFPGPDRMAFPDRLSWADEQLRSTPPGHRWVQPHSSYLLDEDQLSAIADLADRHGARVHVHSSETRAEMDQVRARHAGTPTEVLRRTGLLHDRLVCAHGVHLTPDDIDLLAASGASVAHCPASNLKLASGVAPVAAMTRAGVRVGLGTDGAASANDLDLWQAMRLAAYVQKGVSGDATCLPAAQVLRMATIDGAAALGIDHLVGSIEVGKRADLIVLDASAPSLHPVHDPVSAVANAATRAEVRHVLVDGRVVVDDRRLTTVDVAAVLAEMDVLAKVVAE